LAWGDFLVKNSSMSLSDGARRSEAGQMSSPTRHELNASDVSRRETVTRVFATVSSGLLVRFGLAQDTSARKRRRRKKKRCRKLGEICVVGGKRKCCAGRTCSAAGSDGNPQTVCCVGNGAACEQDRDCCGPSECNATEKICIGIISDRNAKANFGSVDPADMLERLRALPITTWNYLSDDASVRHIGPMAQDFTSAFGVGSDDRTIHPIDGQGVALAALQGLAVQVAALQTEQQRLMEQIAALERRC
jgi:hypothetical protein